MKGQKTGGRLPGVPNKVTQELRERFKDFADNNFDNLQDWLDRVATTDPDKALTIYLALTERIIGKVSSTQLDVTSKGESLKAPVLILNGNPPTDTD